MVESAGGERGFVLIGVVVMVLALTIIGISLYSLSGYESQFFSRTYDERQALYDASGGIEIVKKLVTTPLGSPAGYDLSSARLAIGEENVVSAVAWQDGPLDSTGPVLWSKDVHIRVGVNIRGATHMIEGLYQPSQPNNPYWQLFASANGISYLTGAVGTLRARGGAWQTVAAAADSAWIQSLERSSNVALTLLPTTSPLAVPFINAHYPPVNSPDTALRVWNFTDPLNPSPTSYSAITLDMDAGPTASSYRYFRSETDMWAVARGVIPLYDFFSGAIVTVRVRGTAIWIVPAGMLIDGEFRVERLPGATTANLIIVAGPSVRSGLNSYKGVSFSKAIVTPNDDANVFIVSSATVEIRDGSAATTPPVIGCRNLCVYANAIQMVGPNTGTHLLTLTYRPDFKQVADDLYSRGLLPAASGVQTSSFTFRPGSWRESPALQ